MLAVICNFHVNCEPLKDKHQTGSSFPVTWNINVIWDMYTYSYVYIFHITKEKEALSDKTWLLLFNNIIWNMLYVKTLFLGQLTIQGLYAQWLSLRRKGWETKRKACSCSHPLSLSWVIFQDRWVCVCCLLLSLLSWLVYHIFSCSSEPQN